MKKILITARVEYVEKYNEYRDTIDQSWIELITQAGFLPVIAANNISYLGHLLSDLSFDGLILTGGNSLVQYKGDSPLRDEAESYLLEYCLKNKKPILGVCRGMQLIQSFFNIPLSPIEGHVTKEQIITVNGANQKVNSYHNWGTHSTIDELPAWAYSEDGVVKAIRHIKYKMVGIMWHIERFTPFRKYDVDLLNKVFGEI